MAALLRPRWRPGCPLRRLNAILCRRTANSEPAAVPISTSKRNKDVTGGTVEPIPQAEGKTSLQKQLEEHFGNTDPKSDKNWMTFGYDMVDRDKDRFAHNMTMFFSITICLVWGTFFVAYSPDYRLRDWSIREAHLELHRRECEGLPLIDHDFIDPSKIELPSDEDLADTEIII